MAYNTPTKPTETNDTSFIQYPSSRFVKAVAIRKHTYIRITLPFFLRRNREKLQHGSESIVGPCGYTCSNKSQSLWVRVKI